MYKSGNILESAEVIVKEAAQACRVKLDEAIKQLKAFIQDVTFAIDYEEKQKFLVGVCWFDIELKCEIFNFE